MRRLARPSRHVLMDLGACQRLYCLDFLFRRSQHFRLYPQFISSSRKKMHLWRKRRRVWMSVSQRLKTHKPTVKGGKDGNAKVVLKLQDDVMLCGYEDIQVMWKLLNSPQMKQIGATAATKVVSPSSSRKYSCKQWSSSWMTIFWPNHRNTASPSSFCWVKTS